jgi:hypothetical protein
MIKWKGVDDDILRHNKECKIVLKDIIKITIFWIDSMLAVGLQQST